MSYRVLRQYTLRFGYVRIKRRNESVINISKETKKFRCIRGCNLNCVKACS